MKKMKIIERRKLGVLEAFKSTARHSHRVGISFVIVPATQSCLEDIGRTSEKEVRYMTT